MCEDEIEISFKVVDPQYKNLFPDHVSIVIQATRNGEWTGTTHGGHAWLPVFWYDFTCMLIDLIKSDLYTQPKTGVTLLERNVRTCAAVGHYRNMHGYCQRCDVELPETTLEERLLR